MIYEKNRLKVGLVTPPLSGHLKRGTGVYAQTLFTNIRKYVPDIEIQWADYRSDFGQYKIVHFPYFDPFHRTLVPQSKNKTVVTVHDLTPLKFPDSFPKGIKGSLRWLLQKKALTNVSKIITDSKASRDDIVKILKIPKDMIRVIYPGIADEFRVLKADQARKRINEKFQLSEKYFLYVGDVNYNKNVKTLLKSFNQLSHKIQDVELLLVGSGFSENSLPLIELKKFIQESLLGRRVRILGYVTLEELIALYNQAVCLVYPSLSEGFGFPVLEAMACGCPVITSNVSSLAEIAQDKAVLVNPMDSDQICREMTTLLLQPRFQEQLVKGGLNQRKLFTWQKTVGETADVYHELVR